MFCSYNFVLNKEPNNNDVMSIANIVLNEASNRNDTMRKRNNVRLTTMGTQQFYGGFIGVMQKSRLTRDER